MLEPGSCDFIRSLIDKYQPKYSAQPSTWSHMMLLRVPPIDRETCQQAASEAARRFTPFNITFSRPYRSLAHRGYYVALEYWSDQISKVTDQLRSDIIYDVEKYAEDVTVDLKDADAWIARKKIMRALGNITPHVTIASKLHEGPSWSILRDLKETSTKYGNTPKFTVKAVGLELVEFSEKGALPGSEKFPFEVYQSGEMETRREEAERER